MANNNENTCNHHCEGCGVEGCGARSEKLKPKNPETSFRKIVAVISGKGGVGKSLVSALLAVSLENAGFEVALLDADLTGPSAAKAFGLDGYKALGDENGILPARTPYGLEVIGANNLLDDASAPLIWRGSLLSSLVTQLYTDVSYGKRDVLIIDMPPGTGDIPLTVFQSIPIDGIIIVSSPQELVSMVVEKSINMAKMMNIPIYGLIENMAYVKCPHCEEKFNIYGKKSSEEIALEMGIPLLGELPIDPSLAKLVDAGALETYAGDYLNNAVKAIFKN